MASDAYWMQQALAEAQKGFASGEVPVGAVVVCEGTLLAAAHNSVEYDQDATAHAELKALRAACRRRMAKYLPHATLYVTLTPCSMCATACYWTKVKRLVFGAKDPKQEVWMLPLLLHPRTSVMGGVGAEESRILLQRFFQQLR